MNRKIVSMKRTIVSMNRTLVAMKRTLDAVVKNNPPKQVQILNTDQKSDLDPKSDLSGCADPKLCWSCAETRYHDVIGKVKDHRYAVQTWEDIITEDGPDEKWGKSSSISRVRRRLNLEDWALRLEFDPEILDLCGKILKYFKDGDEDVESFSRMVNAVLENENFSNALCEAFNKNSMIASIVRCNSITATDAEKGIVHQLSEIKRDWFLREAIKQGENNKFFRESLKEGDPEIIVRNAMSILISYCLPQTYLTPRGLVRDRMFDDWRAFHKDWFLRT